MIVIEKNKRIINTRFSIVFMFGEEKERLLLVMFYYFLKKL